MEKNTLLEVCVDSVESAVAAWRGELTGWSFVLIW